MIRRLDTFYQSKDWIKLTRLIRTERVNADGFLICAKCGKPILKAYDAICHHKIFLTAENINDLTISMNPDNIEVVHHVCHNKIHDKLGYKRREVYLIYGSPMSGKHTYADSVDHDGALFCDIEGIRRCISRQSEYKEIKALNPVVFGIRDYILDSIRTRRGYWNTAYIIGGYPLISERERICQMYGAREIFIDTDRETCLQRLKEQPEDRDVKAWERYIDEWWRRFRPSEIPPS